MRNSFDRLLEIIEALHPQKVTIHPPIPYDIYVGFAKWFNIRTRRFLRHSFRAYLFLRDVKRAARRRSSPERRRQDEAFHTRVWQRERERDGNRNSIGPTHLVGCGILLSVITHAFHGIISPVDVIHSLPFDVLRGILAKKKSAFAKKGKEAAEKVSAINVT